MKKVLILVLSADFPPYDKMIKTSLRTWDSVNVDGVETIYYCGLGGKKYSEKVIYLPVSEGYMNMGYKTIQALDWALKNKEFDYVARVNSSCYVSKGKLLDYVQLLQDSNVFAGLEVAGPDNWIWGGGQFIISKDVVEKIVENREKWNHLDIEDKAMSKLVKSLGIPFTNGVACSVDKKEDNKWLCLAYGSGESFEFTDFEEMKRLDGQFFVRVKQDQHRDRDEFIMNELFRVEW